MFNFFKTNNRPKTNDQGPTTLKLSGLHCTSCAVNIDLALEDLQGVTNSKTNYAKSETQVNFDPEQVTLEVIKAEIKKLGYQVHESH